MPSDSNQSALFFVKETAFDETPDGTKKLQQVSFVTEALKNTRQNQPSEEVRTDRQLIRIPTVGTEAGGQITTELSMGAYNDWLEAVMASSWTVVTPVAQTVDIAAGSQTLTSATNGAFNSFKPARYIKIAGATNSSNNGIKKIASINGGGTVITLAAGSLAADQTGASLTLSSKYIQNGKAFASFLFEKQFLGMDAGADRYHYFTGCAFDSLALAIEAKSRVKATFNMMASQGRYAAATKGDGSPTAKSTNPIVTTNANIGGILYAGAAIPVGVKSLPLNIANGLRSRPALGVENSLQFGLNDFTVTGSVSAYFTKKTLLDDVLADAAPALEFYLSDAGGKVLNFYMPKLKLNNANPNVTGKTADVMTDLEFQARGEEGSFTLQLDYLEP